MVREYLHNAHLNISSSLLMSPFRLAWALEELCNRDKFPNNVGKNICWGVYVIFHSICSVKKIKYFTPLKRPILWVKKLDLKMAQIQYEANYVCSFQFSVLFSPILIHLFKSLYFVFISVAGVKHAKIQETSNVTSITNETEPYFLSTDFEWLFVTLLSLNTFVLYCK